VERLTAGGEEGKQPAAGQQCGDIWSRREDLLAVVQHQQHAPLSQRATHCLQQRLTRILPHPEHTRDHRNDIVRGADESQIDDEDPIGESIEGLGSDLHCQSRLARSPRSSQCHEPHSLIKEPQDTRNVCITAN
jgi:hypothetical protein